MTGAIQRGVPMPNPPTASPEQQWLSWLAKQNEQIANYLNSWPVDRAFSLAELQGMVNTLEWHLQQLKAARSAAADLGRQGAWNFGQQLEAAIQSLQGTYSTCQQMYRSTAATQAQIDQIGQRTSAAIGNMWQQTAINTQNTTNTIHQQHIDVMNGNCFVCHVGIGVPGGGYCPRHRPASGPLW